MPIYGRFLHDGTPRHALIEDDTAHFLDDLFGERQLSGETASISSLMILPPVVPTKLFAIGLNYVEHAKESGKPLPDVPLMWFKSPQAIIAHEQQIEIAYPEHSTDYEAELSVVIGTKCRSVGEEDALSYVLGYTCGQDISDRVVQRSESQWARAKSFDTYAPLGPFIHTDLDPQNLQVQSFLNGQLVQDGHTSDMIFSVAKIIAFLSEGITLLPGDVIMTGTPMGIGPLHDGDRLETRIGPMGPLVNGVVNRR